MYFTAGQVSKILGLPTSTIRYYDKEGLIPSVKRSEGGIRIFTKENLVSIRLIQCMKKTGLSLDKIRIFMTLQTNTPENIQKRLDILTRQVQVIHDQMKEWQDMEGITEYKIWLYEQMLRKKPLSSFSLNESEIPEKLLPYYRLLYEDMNIKK